jgi:hypothetical protein
MRATREKRDRPARLGALGNVAMPHCSEVIGRVVREMMQEAA